MHVIMTCGIYKLTSPSGRVYIGQSRNIENRLSGHKKEAKICFNSKKLLNSTKLRASFKKYKWEEFSKEIIKVCEFNDLNNQEIFYISHYNSFNDGLNSTTGGDGQFKRSKETLEKLRLINLGKYGGSQAIPFYIDDVRYVSILDASVRLKIPHKTIHNRLNSKNEKFSNYRYEEETKNVNRKKINNNRSIKIKIDNIIYENASIASMTLKIPLSTILRRARSKSKKFNNYEIL